MNRINVTFDVDLETEIIYNLKVSSPNKKPAKPAVKSKSNSGNKEIKLVGSALYLTDEILDALDAQAESKLALTIENGVLLLTNSKHHPKIKGACRVTLKSTMACKKLKTELEDLGSVFNYEDVEPGIVKLIPVGESNLDSENEIESDIENLLSEDEEEILNLDFNDITQ